MTIENLQYRTSPLFLRNQFLGNNKWRIPDIPKCILTAEELDGLRLIGYDRAKNGNDEHFQRMVHFFLYDYKFEDIWTAPEKRVAALKKYRAVLTPDFSMYIEMHPVVQLYNTFRNRWVGVYLADQGIKVVPTVNWADEASFDFCFEGIAKGSAVAVSTYMASERDNRKDQKEWFLKGYNEMLHRIEPEIIICYHRPFPEMQGNIVHVDYELSSWKHDEDDLKKAALEPCESIRIVKRTGYVVFDKGGGSAHGGGWKPSPGKPYDNRFLGKPGEIIETNFPNGDRFSTKIGDNGKANFERHWTDHNRSHSGHTNPNDHVITWDPNKGNPVLGPPINYPNGNYPVFKRYEVNEDMNRIIDLRNGPPDTLSFKTISEFKWCMHDGGEVEFLYQGKSYTVLPMHPGYNIGEGYRLVDGKPFNVGDNQPVGDVIGNDYDTTEKLLDHIINGTKLRKIITQVEVTMRSI